MRQRLSESISKLDVGSGGSDELLFLELPFHAARTYWITGPTGPRGGHAHKNLRQVFVCIAGEVKIRLCDGVEEEFISLQTGQAFMLEPGIWRNVLPLDQHDILLVIASERYQEDDYIRNFEAYLEWNSDA